MARFTIRFLNDNETHLAQRLLHTVYVEQGGWAPIQGNPTDWRIERDAFGERGLCDKFDGSTLWVGCFDGDRLVGCQRINCREAVSRFDLEDYLDVPEFLLNAKTAEFTRLAVHPDYQKTHAMLSLVVFAYRYLKESGFKYFFTTSKFPQPGEMYCRMGLLLTEVPAFKFNQEEEDECRLLYLEFGRAECDGPAARCCKLVDKVAARKSRVRATKPTDRPARPVASATPQRSAVSWPAQETVSA